MKRVIVLASFILLIGCSSSQKYFPFSDPVVNTVQPLTIGPMIGNVTENSFRLWGRGTKYSVGMVRIREVKTTKWTKPISLKLDCLADQTGTVEFSEIYGKSLTPETLYEYQIGYVHNRYTDKPMSIVWAKDYPIYTVRTFPKRGSNKSTRFILGSCRDQTIWSSKGEDTFSHIKNLLEDEKLKGPSSQFILQMGDQIYVDLDHVPFFTKAQTDIERIWRTYRKSFSWPNFRTVMSELPSYMILDDHEIQNDWTKGRYDNNINKEDKKYNQATLDIGMTAYLAYQGSLNLSEEDIKNKDKNWYEFNHANAEFFVLDTRSENTIHDALKKENNKNDPEVISKKQMEKLTGWLEKVSKNKKADSIKFIVSPVPLFPDIKKKGVLGAPLDKWAAGVWQRHELLEFIRQKNIRKIVFLSGDVHASSIAELTYENKKKPSNEDKKFKIYNVMSSPFNWSTSFGLGLQESNFDFIGREKKSLNARARGMFEERHRKLDSSCAKGTYCRNPSGNYMVRRHSNNDPDIPLLHKDNNFSRITTHGTDSITVEFFSGHDGVLLEKTEIIF